MPTAGVRDWLRRHLARSRGVTANVDFPFPNRFTSMALGLDPARADADDPWSVARLTWALVDVLGHGGVSVPGWSAATPSARPRQYVVARHIADLFDQYATNRPDVLAQWAAGVPGDGTVSVDRELVGPLDASMAWQFELFRAVRERIGEPHPAEHRGAAARRPAGRPARAGRPGARRAVRHQRPLGRPARRARRPRHGPRCRRVRGVPVAGLLGALPAARPPASGRPPARRRRRRRPRRTPSRALVGAFGARDGRPRPRPRSRGRRRAAVPTTSRCRPPCCATSRATSSRTARPHRSPAPPTAPCRCTRAMARCVNSTPSATPSTPASSPTRRSNRETCS